MEIGYYVTAETLENEISYAVCAANLTDYREHSIGMIELAMDRTAYLNSTGRDHTFWGTLLKFIDQIKNFLFWH